MISGGITLLTVAGTIYTAYEAYHATDRQMVVVSAAGGLVFSIFLQALAGKFSNKETSLGTRMIRVLIGDFSSVLSSVVLPFAVIYGYVKRSGETINKKSFGFIQIDQAITIQGRDVSHLYPALVGANFGFLVGQAIGRIISHMFKA